MKNIKGDLTWALLFILCVTVLLIPVTRNGIMEFTSEHAYISGFIKFFILATMGDLIGLRILNNRWVIPSRLFFKACVWGILGMMITLAFSVFTGGVITAQEAGKLPFEGVALATAFFGSLTMNATFGPMMYIYHKFGDYVVDRAFVKKSVASDNAHTGKNDIIDSGVQDTKINSINFAKTIDWQNIVSFFWMKTCVFIWLPLHTIVFLLPPEYRVVVSAFLSILLGIIVALSKKSRK